jgi:DNA-binding MarR family transcriptional regulator
MNHTGILEGLRKIIRAVDLESKRIEKMFGISIPQMLCLRHLYDCNNFQTTHKELTKLLHLNSSTVSGILDRLEKKNLVARLPQSTDKRSTTIILTKDGKKMIDQAPYLMQNRLLNKLDELSDEDLVKIKDALNSLAKILELEDLDASPLLIGHEPQ